MRIAIATIVLLFASSGLQAQVGFDGYFEYDFNDGLIPDGWEMEVVGDSSGLLAESLVAQNGAVSLTKTAMWPGQSDVVDFSESIFRNGDGGPVLFTFQSIHEHCGDMSFTFLFNGADSESYLRYHSSSTQTEDTFVLPPVAGNCRLSYELGQGVCSVRLANTNFSYFEERSFSSSAFDYFPFGELTLNFGAESVGDEEAVIDDVILNFIYIGVDDVSMPMTFDFGHPYPNPFNGVLTIPLDLPISGSLQLSVCNLLGQEVCTVFDGRVQDGQKVFQWYTENVPSGTYVIVANFGSQSSARCVSYLK